MEERRHKRNPTFKNQQLLILLFADEQITISNTEDNLLKAVYKLNQITTEHGLTVSLQKTKLMAFKARDPVRTKTVIDKKIIEQVNLLN